MANKIQICRVYDPPRSKIGTWILVDKLWPRGLKKETLDFDLWLKDIAPSTDLRKWFHEDSLGRWDEFVARYTKELREKASLMEQILQIAKKTQITLFFAAKDTAHNQAVVLKKILESELH